MKRDEVLEGLEQRLREIVYQKALGTLKKGSVKKAQQEIKDYVRFKRRLLNTGLTTKNIVIKWKRSKRDFSFFGFHNDNK